MTGRAQVNYYDPINDIANVKLDDHNFEFGGQADSYCYGHQSFDCWDHLTDAELDQLYSADYSSLA